MLQVNTQGLDEENGTEGRSKPEWFGQTLAGFGHYWMWRKRQRREAPRMRSVFLVLRAGDV